VTVYSDQDSGNDPLFLFHRYELLLLKRQTLRVAQNLGARFLDVVQEKPIVTRHTRPLAPRKVSSVA
jgi:hypothetical protein